MQTANEILQNIFGILVQIQQNSSQGGGPEKSVKAEDTKQIVNISTALASFAGVKEKTKVSFINFAKDLFEITAGGKAKVLDAFSDGLVKISHALPLLSQGLGSLSSGALWGRTSRAMGVLRDLFTLMEELGTKKSGGVKKAIKLFDEMGDALNKLGKTLNTLSTFMMVLGLSFVVFAAGLVLSSMILGSGNPLWGVVVLIGVVGALILVFMGISQLGKYIDPGIATVKGMGQAFAWLILGIVGFVVGLLLISLLIGTGGGVKGIGGAFGIMLLTIGIILGMFMFIGMIGKYIKPGIEVIKGIGFSFVLLILGIYLFALGLVSIAALLGESPNSKGIFTAGLILLGSVLLVGALFWLLGQAKTSVNKGIGVAIGMGVGLFILILAVFLFATGLILIAKSMGESENGAGIALAFLIMGASVVGVVMLFRLMGSSIGTIAKGFAAVALISIGLILIAVSMMFIAEAAKRIQALLGTGGTGDMEVPLIGTIPGGIVALGTMALIFVAAAGLFAILGIPVVAGLIILGSVTAIMISVALILVATSMVTMVNAVKKVGDVNVEKTIGDSIGAVLNGVLNGISVLSEGKTGLVGAAMFMKNSAKLFAAIGILMALSISLSMFARALTAFAVLGNMRIITGTDDKGNPIFGETVSTVNVAANISESIRLFLTSLIESTDGLTKEKGKEIQRMMKLLTGKNGVLIAVNQFAEVVQTFAKFGAAGEIGYIDTVAVGGVDKDGNPNVRKEYKKVPLTVVAKNIISAFTTFVDRIVQFGAALDLENGSTGKKMMDLATILMGSKFAIGVFGTGISREKPGILEPIIKFSEMIAQYADSDTDGKLRIMSEDGKTSRVVDPKKAAQALMSGINAFIEAIASNENAFSSDNISKAEDKVKDLQNVIEKLKDAADLMKEVSDLNKGISDLGDSLNKLSEALSEQFNVEKLEQIAKTLEKISGIKFSNAGEIDKITTAMNKESKSSGGGSGGSGGGGRIELPDGFQEALVAAIQKALVGSSYQFEFKSNSQQGIVTFSK